MLAVLLIGVTVDEDIIEVAQHKVPVEPLEAVVHQPLEDPWCSLQSCRDHSPLVLPMLGSEGSLVQVIQAQWTCICYY